MNQKCKIRLKEMSLYYYFCLCATNAVNANMWFYQGAALEEEEDMEQ